MAKRSSRKFQFQFGWGGMIAIIISSFCALLWMFILGLWVGQKIVGKPAKTGILAPQMATMSPPPLPGENTTTQGNTNNQISNNQTEASYSYKQNTTSQTKTNATNITEQPLSPKSFYSLKQNENNTQSQVSKPKTNKQVNQKVSNNATTGTITNVTNKNKTPQKYFVLQIASYREKDNAISEARRWRRKGYDAKVVKVFLGPKKGVWYRVYLGQFNTMQEAIAFARRLAKKEGLKSYIVEINK